LRNILRMDNIYKKYSKIINYSTQSAEHDPGLRYARVSYAYISHFFSGKFLPTSHLIFVLATMTLGGEKEWWKMHGKPRFTKSWIGFSDIKQFDRWNYRNDEWMERMDDYYYLLAPQGEAALPPRKTRQKWMAGVLGDLILASSCCCSQHNQLQPWLV
jgi:hypothetical protein